MDRITSKENLFHAMRQGVFVITPNNRLSHQLLQDYFEASRLSVCDKPHCLPYNTFLKQMYQKIQYLKRNLPILLTPELQRGLWRQILNKNDGLMSEIQNAWTYIHLWQIDVNHPLFSSTKETLLFQEKAREFQSQLKKINAITTEEIPEILLRFRAEIASIQVIWACFDDFSPLHQSLQQAFKHQYIYDLSPTDTKAHLLTTADQKDERQAMMQWVKQQLNAGIQKIGVVVPTLEKEFLSLARFLEDNLEPEEFNLSLGQPLKDYPLVHHALQWLALEKSTLSNHDARLLLYSPFIQGSKSEFAKRADFVQEHKIFQEQTLSFPALIQALTPNCPILADLLTSLSDLPEKTSPNEWVRLFKERLQAVGFPGEYSLDSSNYQCFQRLMALIETLAQWSLISPIMIKEDVLAVLNDLVKTTIFQSQTKSAPVQILGLLEASGCCFESVWVTSMTSQNLPNKTKLSAFIPLKLQKDLGMPHATAEREIVWAKQLLERLQNGCQNIVFSYPSFTEDAPNSPCPLIQDLPEFTRPNVPSRKFPACLASYEETYSLPLMPQETILGGTTLLSNQAKCPFRAFAAHRLHAKPLPEISETPSALQKGLWIHQIMESLWRSFKTQANIKSLSKEYLDSHLLSIIEQSLPPQSPSFPPLIKEIEKERLHSLIRQCMDWELQREPFEIKALEQEYTLVLGDINFRVRVDRLDTMLDGTTMVIDYKSRLPNQKPWFDERPEAPQILLYALLDETIRSLLLMEFHQGKITLCGLSEHASELSGIQSLKKDELWASHVQRWHQQLTQLANEFQNGHCPPIPLSMSTCLSCDFSSICRVRM